MSNCALVLGMPLDEPSVVHLVKRSTPASFGLELRVAYPECRTVAEVARRYMDSVPRAWRDTKRTLEGSGVTFLSNADRDDLANALRSYDVVALLAHHVLDEAGISHGVELANGKTIRSEELALIAPQNDSVVHLGICRSDCLVGTLKFYSSRVRVIACQGQLDPEFFLLMFAATIRHWRISAKDYVDAHMEIRNSTLSELGVT